MIETLTDEIIDDSVNFVENWHSSLIEKMGADEKEIDKSTVMLRIFSDAAIALTFQGWPKKFLIERVAEVVDKANDMLPELEAMSYAELKAAT